MIQLITNLVVIVDVLMSLKYQMITIAMITMNQFVAAMELPMATNVMLKMRVSQNGLKVNVTKHLTLLLFIGLAWGQEYDPETGEVVIKQYDPETGEVVIKQYDPETGELIKDQNYPDSLVSPSHPKVNSDLKNISIYNLTKEQKKKYNQNRIRIRKKNFDWYAYIIKEGLFRTEILDKTDFFIYTGYPDKAEIAEHNTQLKRKNQSLGGISSLLGLVVANLWNDGAGTAIFYGCIGYLYNDYNVKKLEGASLKNAKIIEEEYNNDLMQKIINEND